MILFLAVILGQTADNLILSFSRIMSGLINGFLWFEYLVLETLQIQICATKPYKLSDFYMVSDLKLLYGFRFKTFVWFSSS